MNVRVVWDLACKDLRLFIADRRAAILCFAVPILLASAFGTIFRQPGDATPARVPVLVVDECAGTLTRRVVDALRASEYLDAVLTDREEALRRLADRQTSVVLVLPDDFERVAALGRAVTVPGVEIYHHPASTLEARWTEGILTELVLREAAASLLGPMGLTAAELRRPFVVHRASVPDTGELAANAYAHSFCGMTLQYLLFWGMDSGLLLLRERRRGFWRRLRVAPVTPTTLLAGKVLATMLLALLQIAVTFGFGAVVFGVRLTGSGAGFVALALAAAVLSAATGLVVAALGGTEARTRSVAVLAILTLSLLGGLWIPSFLMPGWVQRLAWVLPTSWAVRGFEGVTWQTMGAGPALRCAGVLVGFSAVFLLIALWGFRRTDAQPARGRGD